MRFIIMHKTNAHWESGASPTADLVERVGGMLDEWQKAGVLVAGEGLRPTSEGVRLTFSGGKRAIARGPLTGANELPAAFTILRTASLDEAVEHATRQAEALGDCEMDIRPVTEPWDIGMGARPTNLTTRRYMIVRKATTDSEAGRTPTGAQQAGLARAMDAVTSSGAHVVSETLRPSARGRRYTNSQNGVTYSDGPFTESKEMIGGYVIVATPSLQDTDRFVRRYMEVVPADEVDVRELEN